MQYPPPCICQQVTVDGLLAVDLEKEACERVDKIWLLGYLQSNYLMNRYIMIRFDEITHILVY